MCNQLPKYGVLIAFLSLFQMAKAQDRTDECMSSNKSGLFQI